MSNETHRPDAMTGADTDLRPELTEGAAASEVPRDVVEASPTGPQVADSWAEAADDTGAVEATRRIPEPDSLGG
jgi:hypothetical protein